MNVKTQTTNYFLCAISGTKCLFLHTRIAVKESGAFGTLRSSLHAFFMHRWRGFIPSWPPLLSPTSPIDFIRSNVRGGFLTVLKTSDGISSGEEAVSVKKALWNNQALTVTPQSAAHSTHLQIKHVHFFKAYIFLLFQFSGAVKIFSLFNATLTNFQAMSVFLCCHCQTATKDALKVYVINIIMAFLPQRSWGTMKIIWNRKPRQRLQAAFLFAGAPGDPGPKQNPSTPLCEV